MKCSEPIPTGWRRRFSHIIVFAAVLLWAVAELTMVESASAQAGATATIELPPGFAVTEIAGLNFPTDMAFLPTGELIVLEKGTGDGPDGSARVRLVRDGALRSQPVMTMPTNPFGDSGLLGLAIDPGFTDNGHIYIWHATGEASPGWSGESVNRLSRFTVDRNSLTASLNSEQIILDDVPWWIMHNGGGMAFDEEGRLYLSVGDVTRGETAQQSDRFTGKVLRIVPTNSGYAIPSDNPYVGDDAGLPEVFSLGLRNPFRLSYRASDQRIYVADVGNEAWEEVNLVAPGVNFGWPAREGPCPLNEILPCDAAPPSYTDPILFYGHDEDMGASVTGLDFYEGTEFPPEFHDQLFFADLNLGTIEVGFLEEDGFEIAPFATGARGIVDVEYHDERIYYLQIIGGKIGVIHYTGIPNQLPVAALSADATLAPSPLTVRFDASDSFDPDGEIVEYRWEFGDDSDPLTTPLPRTTHIYARDGAYTARLTVVDDDGALSEAATLEIQAYSGEPPVIDLVNLTEAGRTLFHGGDRWDYVATRAGGIDDLDPERPFEWVVAMHHNQHSHPIITGQVTDRAIFEIDTDNHGGAWNIWYRFHLYMNTATGQQVHVSADIRPALVTLGVEANPAATAISVNGGNQATPHRYRAVVGTEHTLEAPAEILYEDGVGAFDTWNVHAGGWPAVSHPTDDPPVLTDPELTFRVPDTSTTYTAFYRYDRPAEKVYLPLIGR